ncbi:hypothetical protein GIB67_006267 [Kingdonia uniflora]|uniref:Protein ACCUMULATION AND REPLICATION OF CHLOROPLASTS 3 n=1 Tax=Kingdonia uniflora TaxID=39325 RepID=A0A7J7P592_9MAGN|nr:hypothetical protein GIB67_006267 [Kingdonia uniflora]
MELQLPRVSLFHHKLSPNSYVPSLRNRNIYINPNRVSPTHTRINSTSSQKSSTTSTNDYLSKGFQEEVSWGGGDGNLVEVIGIGSRKDAFFDYCIESPFQTSLSLMRFWNIVVKDSLKVELQWRPLRKDLIPRNAEVPTSQLSSLRAAILVASAGYGVDHISAIELLKAVKSANGLTVGIILKPFSFEGQRRQDEVIDLVSKLREHTSFCVVVDTDSLLKKEVLTLAEALKSANNAVFLAINSISILMSDVQKKILDHPHIKMQELNVQKVIQTLGRHKEAKIGYGAGSNMKSSIQHAVFDCSFMGEGIKDLDGLVVCTHASANLLGDDDLHTFSHMFRQITGFEREILVSFFHEPNLEPNMVVTIIIVLGQGSWLASAEIFSQMGVFKGMIPSSILGDLKGHVCAKYDHNNMSVVLVIEKVYSKNSRAVLESNPAIFGEQKVSQRKGFLSGLAMHFPFVFSLLNRDHPETKEIVSSSDNKDMPHSNSVDVSSVYRDQVSEEPPSLRSRSYDEAHALRESSSEDNDSITGILESSKNSVLNVYDPTYEGEHSFEREPLLSWNVGPAFHLAQEWAKEREAISGANPILDTKFSYTLPVGVKPSKNSTISPEFLKTPEPSEPGTLDDVNAGLEAIINFYNSTSSRVMGKYVDSPRKQGSISARAASMLESERDSQKKWSPVMEMQYQGGIYRGRCQGGLPEGKGRLTVVDGNIYDGMWRFGKRSGPGAFYFSNGDVFQGSWRDDLMHGKGWFYFHTGDRWYANFWKGKANGESRFYSKNGEIFFGHFQDGWRHGHCLHIDGEGKRCAEIWEEGVLLSRQQLDSAIGAA